MQLSTHLSNQTQTSHQQICLSRCQRSRTRLLRAANCLGDAHVAPAVARTSLDKFPTGNPYVCLGNTIVRYRCGSTRLQNYSMSPPVSSPPVRYKLWGHHVSRVREQRFEHELQKTSQTQVWWSYVTEHTRTTHNTRCRDATSAWRTICNTDTRRARDRCTTSVRYIIYVRDERAIQKTCVRRARDTENMCATSARHRTCNIEHRTQMRDERVIQNTCARWARDTNMQHRTYNIYMRQARDAEHGTRMRRASDTEHATRMRGTRDRKSEACRRLRHVSLIRRLEVHILSSQVLRVLCSNVNYYRNYVGF